MPFDVFHLAVFVVAICAGAVASITGFGIGSLLTALLGLPAGVGLTLIFGVLRKELSLLMLMQALGTTNVASVMTAAQMVIFTLFVTFYLPCVATLASMVREVGGKLTAAAAGAMLVLAVAISVFARAVFHFLP